MVGASPHPTRRMRNRCISCVDPATRLSYHLSGDCWRTVEMRFAVSTGSGQRRGTLHIFIKSISGQTHDFLCAARFLFSLACWGRCCALILGFAFHVCTLVIEGAALKLPQAFRERLDLKLASSPFAFLAWSVCVMGVLCFFCFT